MWSVPLFFRGKGLQLLSDFQMAPTSLPSLKNNALKNQTHLIATDLPSWRLHLPWSGQQVFYLMTRRISP